MYRARSTAKFESAWSCLLVLTQQVRAPDGGQRFKAWILVAHNLSGIPRRRAKKAQATPRIQRTDKTLPAKNFLCDVFLCALSKLLHFRFTLSLALLLPPRSQS